MTIANERFRQIRVALLAVAVRNTISAAAVRNRAGDTCAAQILGQRFTGRFTAPPRLAVRACTRLAGFRCCDVVELYLGAANPQDIARNGASSAGDAAFQIRA